VIVCNLEIVIHKRNGQQQEEVGKVNELLCHFHLSLDCITKSVTFHMISSRIDSSFDELLNTILYVKRNNQCTLTYPVFSNWRI
jgi:hypothetical protein